ncbi:AraC family transcriptional regulator [Paenibacillus guangzhouensis]|uniref:AraC family transcriptional regulator n=1 Tax=Paenibacillus guangzhouensis TaxID=1473112 RepID=UPI0012669588|nr:AraC family transcriptional regulator [Paenibacillus guangzhouensis]
MYLHKETQSMLNEIATVLQTSDACFKVHYWGINPQLFDNPVHKHSFFEVCYVLAGVGTYMDDGVEYQLRSGAHFCSRPGVTHQIRTQEGLYLLYVAFELDESLTQGPMREAYEALSEHATVFVQQDEHHPTALLWKSLMLQDGSTGNLPAAAIGTVAYSLILSFLTLFGVHTNVEKVNVQRTNSNRLLQQAKLYIRDNLAGTIGLTDVARYLNVSERHLSRLFSAGIGETFTDFVRHERVRQATRLLLRTELPIKQIAEETGFSSVHYFTRVFMEDKKLPPGRFREMKQNVTSLVQKD